MKKLTLTLLALFIFSSISGQTFSTGTITFPAPLNEYSVKIDVTPTFESDVQTFSLDPIKKQLLNIQGFQKDRSFIQKISSYPINVEIKTVKTFATTAPQLSLNPTPKIGTNLPAALDAGVVTIELNTSMLLLPKVPMRKSTFDARVGFFATQIDVFEEESQKSDTEIFAVRWKLEPKNAEDAAKQKRGELIEPKKPIVYYIDPATPIKWRKYIKQGIDDWQVALKMQVGKMLFVANIGQRITRR